MKSTSPAKTGVRSRSRTSTATPHQRSVAGRADPPAEIALPKVRVRMYRQGLGDCFLVTFHLGADEKHVLIDCGTLGAKYTDVGIPDAIDDIDQTTNGHLHLVVATHQHQDHLSGFSRLGARFDPRSGKTIDQVWLAWTEDPEDPDAQTLGKARDDLGLAVTTAAYAMRAGSGEDSVGLAIESLLGFFGHTEFTDLARGKPVEVTFGAAAKNSMDSVRGLGGQPKYRKPGEGPIEEDWLEGFRFYVLGPPRNLDALHDTGTHGSSELYALTALCRAANLHLQLAVASRGLNSEESGIPARDLPFDLRFRVDRQDARIQMIFRETYLNPVEQWRAVDTDWLNVASNLAIQLDKFTNNTSLALAIERTGDGKVLLFPGDAQEGNWLSWHDPKMKWEIKSANGAVSSITAKDLLARTVFYKVGHHSSHNATAKAQGLEMMAQEARLTAFIPVDRQVALGRNPKGSWKMPARQLYRRLLEKCQGRVLRSDLGWAARVSLPSEDPIETEFADIGTEAEWTAWKKGQADALNVHVEQTFIDYVLE